MVVDVTTMASDASRGNEVDCDHDLNAFPVGLETDPSLSKREELQARLVALDDLDRRFGGSEAFMNPTNSQNYRRAQALRLRLEAANEELYQSFRSDITRGAFPQRLLQWFQGSASQNRSVSPSPGLGFDWRDELVSGIFQFREPSEPHLQGSPEMVPYQPTPVRHILDLIAANVLSKGDILVDLGSGLGHVPLMVSLLTGIRSVGIEVQAVYVDSAQECAQSLHLGRVRFVAKDARAADLSDGTLFYLYSPFNGSILTDVLSALRREGRRKAIKICSLGPCTITVANEAWLKASTLLDMERITVFESR
jgi:Histone methylation protein DOT1